MRSNTGNFRWDIQGLRAIAVLAVVIFHLSPVRLPGGFIGVDIFFVISGYLIIGFIWRDLNNGTFSLLNFYSRRVKRLFPAYFVAILATSVAAYYLLLPEETVTYAHSLVSSLFYLSNFYFYLKSSYFDSELQLSPLLHTWSLSVEEQFYIVFPLFLIAVYRISAKRIVIALSVLAFLSFILSEIMVRNDESFAFFASPSRFWQFITGGLVSIYAKKIKIHTILRDSLGLAGMLMIFYCLFAYHDNIPFPGVNAVLPTFATALVIISGSSKGIIYRILSIKPCRFIGDISYSLYLWHWPVIIFYKLGVNSSLAKADKTELFGLLFISIFLGYLSWRFVENTFKRFTISRNSFRPILISSSVSLVFGAMAFLARDGLPYRFSDQQLRYSAYLKYDTGGYREGSCFLSSNFHDFHAFDQKQCVAFKRNTRNYLLLGDSHAAHWYSALAEIKKSNGSITQVTSSGCKPTFMSGGKKYCTDLIRWALKYLVKAYPFDAIILSARWKKDDLPALKKTLSRLIPSTRNIVVLGPIIEYDLPLPRLLALHKSGEIKRFRHYREIKKLDDYFQQQLSHLPVKYISVLNTICPSPDHCMVTTPNDIPLQSDYGHLTHMGALALLHKMHFLGS